MDNKFAEMMGIKSIDELKSDASRKRKAEGKGCALCDYTGYLTNDLGKTLMCTCGKEQFLKELFIKAQVPNAYLNKVIDDWNTRTDSMGNELGSQQTVSEKVYSLLKFYEKKLHKICDNECPKLTHSGHRITPLHSLLFEGNVGSGKTFLASVLVQSAIRQGLSAKYYDWSELISFMSDFDKKSDFDEVVDDFKNLDLIAIDGVEFYSYAPAHTVPQIDRLSKARINSGKPTLIFSLGNISQINGGSGWISLINKCLAIRLPQAIK